MMNSFGPLDRLLVAVARDVPHHDAVALLDLLAADLGVDQRGAPHMRQRRLPADHLRHHGVDQRRIVAQLLVLVGMLVQRQHRAAHGVAGGVVAADDQQDDVAHQIVGVHVPRGVAVRHHRQQVVARRRVDALVPELCEIGRSTRPSPARRCSGDSTTPLLGSAVETSDQRVSLRRSSQGKSNSVASICVVSSIETRSTKLKVSLRGRLSSTFARALADQLGEFVQMRRREHRRHGLALRRMPRLVHRDEARPVIARRHVADRDAAERRRRRRRCRGWYRHA